jgi:hypothetical protein
MAMRTVSMRFEQVGPDGYFVDGSLIEVRMPTDAALEGLEADDPVVVDGDEAREASRLPSLRELEEERMWAEYA